MIRLLCFLVLLGASSIVLAEPLYKWFEPDGSITFSKEPPPAGIKYEPVDTSRPAKHDARKAAKTANPPIGAALPQPQQNPGSAPAPREKITRPISTQATLLPSVQRSSTQQTLNSSVLNSNTKTLTTQNDRVNNSRLDPARQDPAELAARSRKQRQCEDLKKRVVSLERRLRNRLTPADMDNTVVHMARYQRSYDQHCVQ